MRRMTARPANAHQARLLRLLRDGGPNSRAQLGDQVDLSRSKLAVEVDRLLETGLVVADGLAASRGGRRSHNIRLAPELRFLGVDIGATSIDVAVTNAELEVLGHLNHPMDVREGPVAVFEQVLSLAAKLRASGLAEGFDGAGIGVPGPVRFPVQGLSRKGEFAPVDLELRPGEIVGLAGLVGSGRSEILETIYGARKASTGTVTVAGKQLRPGSVRAAVAAGIGLAPEERKAQALLMTESVTRNVSVSSLSRFARIGWIDRGGERKAARSATRELQMRPDNPDAAVRTLSGGNQQKAVLARWLLRGCRVLLLDEPTRGVDVGARAELYAVIRRLADEGLAVLLVSSEVPEVLGLADRVLVLREGEVVHTAPAQELDEHRVLDLVMEGSPTP
ncbi:Vitamin B12 import ATP-binding protein BtuD [Streptomyces griseus]